MKKLPNTSFPLLAGTKLCGPAMLNDSDGPETLMIEDEVVMWKIGFGKKISFLYLNYALLLESHLLNGPIFGLLSQAQSTA